MECDHPAEALIFDLRRGTFDYLWQVCGRCHAERLQDENGLWGQWLEAGDAGL